MLSKRSARMNSIRSEFIMQRWNFIQYDQIHELNIELGAMSPKLECVIHILDWVRIEEFTGPLTIPSPKVPCVRPVANSTLSLCDICFSSVIHVSSCMCLHPRGMDSRSKLSTPQCCACLPHQNALSTSGVCTHTKALSVRYAVHPSYTM